MRSGRQTGLAIEEAPTSDGPIETGFFRLIFSALILAIDAVPSTMQFQRIPILGVRRFSNWGPGRILLRIDVARVAPLRPRKCVEVKTLFKERKSPC
jgi:hypothetical protein